MFLLPIEIQLYATLSKYIDSSIKLENNKYNQKLPHIYVMTKWIANNYFFVIKSIYSAFTC